MLRRLTIGIFLSTLIISCDKENSPEKISTNPYPDNTTSLLDNLKKAGVGLTVGKSITTGDLIYTNTKTGTIVQPCGKLKFPNKEYPDTKQYQNIETKTSGCEVELVDPTPEVKNIFEASMKNFTAKLKINGEIVEVNASSSVNFTWKQSCHFGSTSGGDIIVWGSSCNFICKLLPPGTKGC